MLLPTTAFLFVASAAVKTYSWQGVVFTQCVILCSVGHFTDCLIVCVYLMCVCVYVCVCVCVYVSVFVQELNKLRMAALTYGSPELIQFIVDLLEKERSTPVQHKGAALLERAINFLKTCKDCSERLGSSSSSSSNTAAPQEPSIIHQ